MTAAAPWSVKGIDPKAREVAKALARRSGMTLGEWLNRVILEDDVPEEITSEEQFSARPVRPFAPAAFEAVKSYMPTPPSSHRPVPFSASSATAGGADEMARIAGAPVAGMQEIWPARLIVRRSDGPCVQAEPTEPLKGDNRHETTLHP